MNRVVSLSSPDALDVRDGEVLYHGGSQKWYDAYLKQKSGCGPTSCANLFWYLTKTRENCSSLCSYDASQKPGFVQLMEDVWKYVTPGGMGVKSTDYFADRAKQYGEAKGVALDINTINVAPLGRGKHTVSEVLKFIETALACNLPVAFLNRSNGTLQNLFSWHWVTVVSLRNDEALIYDQGRTVWINLKQWVETTAMGGGFVSIGETVSEKMGG